MNHSTHSDHHSPHEGESKSAKRDAVGGKTTHLSVFGWIGTLVAVSIGAYLAYTATTSFSELRLNEKGDFLAGLFAPIALLWLILGYHQNGRELAQNTESLRLQVKELNDSVAAQNRQAEAIQANTHHAAIQVFFQFEERLMADLHFEARNLLFLLPHQNGIRSTTIGLPGDNLSECAVSIQDMLQLLLSVFPSDNPSDNRIENYLDRLPENTREVLKGKKEDFLRLSTRYRNIFSRLMTIGACAEGEKEQLNSFYKESAAGLLDDFLEENYHSLTELFKRLDK
jgi:hypothetical protein